MKKGDLLEFTITDVNAQGKGLAQHGNHSVEIPYSIPGQTVKALIRSKKHGLAKALVKEVLQPAPGQINPCCPHFGQPPTAEGTGCGGCQWQTLDYGQQLQLKQRMVAQVLAPLPEMGLELPTPQSIVPSPQSLRYRNKVELSFGDKIYLSDEDYRALRENKQPMPQGFYLGFHIPGSFGSLVDIQECHLLSQEAQKVYQTIKALLPSLGGDVYHLRNHEGFWRYLVLREGFHTGDIMVHLNTTDIHQPDWQPLLKALQSLDLNGKRVRSVLHSVHTSVAQFLGYEAPSLLMGEPYIEDHLLNLRFQISPYAFFQTNTQAAEKLYQEVLRLAELKGNEVVYDLYSGTGTIAQVLASKGAQRVYGLEEITTAVEDAKANAARNGLSNCHFLAGKVEHELPQLLEKEPANLVIIDPPRVGLHPKVVKMLNELKVPRLVYVSCNPAALARDLEGLCLHGGYHVNEIQPVDLFPQTGHVETVVQLSHSGI